MMLRYKGVYEDMILDLAFHDCVDDAIVHRRRIEAIAIIYASVSLNILYSIVEYKNNLFE